jgi:DNA-directed RNA polymerase subunit RPC12/RpoP
MIDRDASEVESADLLRRFLAGRDVVCPQCGYNLRDLMGDRCPECGEKIVLRVNLAEVKQKLLIAGLVGISAGVGLNGLLLIYVCIRCMIDGWRGGFDTRFTLINLIGFVAEAGALIFWLVCWRRIRRASAVRRSLLVMICWGLTLADIVAFSVLIR